MKFQKNYTEEPMQFVLDLLKLDVQKIFEESDDTTFKFVQELRKILRNKRQPQELLQDILVCVCLVCINIGYRHELANSSAYAIANTILSLLDTEHLK